MRHTSFFTATILGTCLLVTSAFAIQTTNPKTVVSQLGLHVGQWRTSIRVTAAAITPAKKGYVLPEAARTELRKKVGTSFSTNDCIGSEPDAKGDLILPGINISHQCQLSNFSKNGSGFKLDASCGSTSEGFYATTNIQSSFNNAKMNSNIKTKTVSQNAGIITNMVLTASSIYVGECRLR
ncbi:MAG: DUF3617 family protein [Oxalobacteraceae bacterium]|nr:MAG: DUF3617 family protein [Oxalobacteraceae bacterium]